MMIVWDEFYGLAVIVKPTGGSAGPFGGNESHRVSVSTGVENFSGWAGSRYASMFIPATYKDEFMGTVNVSSMFSEQPDSITLSLYLAWGAYDPYTATIELRMLDNLGGDELVGMQTISKAMLTQDPYDDYAYTGDFTFDTSGMFSSDEQAGGLSEGNYLFRTGGIPGINLPPPEPFPPPQPPVTSSYPSNYRPSQPISGGSPYRPTGGTLVKDGYVLTKVCNYDGLNIGFDNGVTCQWVRVRQENVYFFKDMKDLEKNIDRYQGRDSFRDPSRAGLTEIPKYI